jgi:transposase-like protein
MNVKFTEAFKIQSVQKALNRTEGSSIQEIADSLGVGLSSLTKWIRQARNHEFEMASEAEIKMMSDEKRPQDWTLDKRLEMVIKCAALDDEAINALCREQGIYPHHIQQWKSDFVSGKKTPLPIPKTTEVKQLKTENKALKKELNRKDRALAETAALLVLQKKVNELWGGDEDS